MVVEPFWTRAGLEMVTHKLFYFLYYIICCVTMIICAKKQKVLVEK